MVGVVSPRTGLTSHVVDRADAGNAVTEVFGNMGQDCKRQAMEPFGNQNNEPCSLMEALGYTTVVDERDKAWLHYQIQRAGTPHYKSSAPQNPFKRKIGRSGCRGSANASQKSHCRTLPRASTLIPGFLLSPVCSEEILGKMETDNTFIDSEHVCPHPNFQNGDSGNAQNSNPSGRLGSLPGLKGCLFSHPYRKVLPTLSKVCAPVKDLPIPHPAFRPSPGPMDLHNGHERRVSISTRPGHKGLHVYRRLDHSGRIQEFSRETHGSHNTVMFRSSPNRNSFSWGPCSAPYL